MLLYDNQSTPSNQYCYLFVSGYEYTLVGHYRTSVVFVSVLLFLVATADNERGTFPFCHHKHVGNFCCNYRHCIPIAVGLRHSSST